MSNNEHAEEELLNLFIASGRDLHFRQFNSAIVVAITATATQGIRSLELRRPFEDALIEALEGKTVSSSLKGLVLCPIVADPKVGVFPDRVSYNRKRQEVHISRNINFADWINASLIRKIDLLAKNFIVSIESVPEKYLTKPDRDMLMDAICRKQNQAKGAMQIGQT